MGYVVEEEDQTPTPIEGVPLETEREEKAVPLVSDLVDSLKREVSTHKKFSEMFEAKILTQKAKIVSHK